MREYAWFYHDNLNCRTSLAGRFVNYYSRPFEKEHVKAALSASPLWTTSHPQVRKTAKNDKDLVNEMEAWTEDNWGHEQTKEIQARLNDLDRMLEDLWLERKLAKCFYTEQVKWAIFAIDGPRLPQKLGNEMESNIVKRWLK